MAYVAVNKDGSEVIFYDEPSKHISKMVSSVRNGSIIEFNGKPHMFIRDNRKYSPPEQTMMLRDIETQETFDTKVSGGSSVKLLLNDWMIEGWGRSENVNDYGIDLPAGSIEKLIGRKLTWADEPVEL